MLYPLPLINCKFSALDLYYICAPPVTECGAINLQELCLERLSSWLKNGNRLGTRLMDKLKIMVVCMMSI